MVISETVMPTDDKTGTKRKLCMYFIIIISYLFIYLFCYLFIYFILFIYLFFFCFQNHVSSGIVLLVCCICTRNLHKNLCVCVRACVYVCVCVCVCVCVYVRVKRLL